MNGKNMTRQLLAVVTVLLVVRAGAARGSTGIVSTRQVRSVAQLSTPPESLLWMEMRNVKLHLDERATLRVRRLRGEMVSAVPGQPAVLDDRGSYSIRVTGGTVGLTGEDLSTVLNTFVFAYPGAPLRRLRARPQGDGLSLTGTLHKGVDLNFEITSTLSLTPAGLIQLRPTSTRILGVDGARLLRALGLHLDDLLNLEGSHGASVKGDDIYLDVTKILPPPVVAGTLASARVEGSEVVIAFKQIPDDSVFSTYVRPDSTTPNFVYFRGSRLRFGKLLMEDTDLLIADAAPADPFDLSLAEYAKQLVAGTSRTLANQGLRVEMPDYATLGPATPKTTSKR